MEDAVDTRDQGGLGRPDSEGSRVRCAGVDVDEHRDHQRIYGRGYRHQNSGLVPRQVQDRERSLIPSCTSRAHHELGSESHVYTPVIWCQPGSASRFGQTMKSPTLACAWTCDAAVGRVVPSHRHVAGAEPTLSCSGVSAACVAVETGLSASAVLSTLPRPTSALVCE